MIVNAALLPPSLIVFSLPFLFDLCLFHWAFVFVCLCSQKGLKNVFDEAILAALEPPEPKKKRKCVLLWEAPTFTKHTHTEHIHTCNHLKYIHKHLHSHTHTHHTHTQTHTPFPCSAKAGWQHCPPQGRLERKQPTKFQIIVCNNMKLHP